MSGNSGSKKALGVVLAIVAGVAVLVSEYGGEDDGFEASGVGTSTSGFGIVDPPVLNYPEENQLVKRLKAAYDVQGVCYGWRLNDSETGSHLGAPAPTNVADDPSCEKYVEFVADYTYNSADEEFTAVTYDINSSLANPPAKADLTALGIGADELLDEPNVYVTDAIAALPMLVAQKGEAPAVPAAKSEGDNLAGQSLERPIEWRWLWVVLAIGLLGGGLIWLILGVVRAARKPARAPAPQTSQSHGTDQGMGSQ